MLEIVNCVKCGKAFEPSVGNCPYCSCSSPEVEPNNLERNLGVPEAGYLGRTGNFETYVTISEKYVFVGSDMIKHHPLYGLNGGLYFFKLSLLAVPLAGIFYSLITGTKEFEFFGKLWLFYCIGIDSLLFMWGYWLGNELKSPREKTIHYVYKYLIVLCVIGVFTTYIGYKTDPLAITHSKSPVLIFCFKNILFSSFFMFYFSLAYRVKVTFFKFLKPTDAYFSEHGIDVSALPREDTWVAYAQNFSELTKNTNPTDFRNWVSNTDRGVQENVANVKSAGDPDVEKFSLRIAALKNALNNGLITEDDYAQKKKQILDEL
ncbi:MAG: hypothetical protein CMF70_01945 [Magnetovibrio sp.]|nr:hypothetical protein [Magnetovibrio sp.]